MYKFHLGIKNVESARGPKETSESGFIFCLLNVRDMACTEISAICAHNGVKMSVKTVERCKAYWDLRGMTAENAVGQRTLTERGRACVVAFSEAIKEVAKRYIEAFDSKLPPAQIASTVASEEKNVTVANTESAVAVTDALEGAVQATVEVADGEMREAVLVTDTLSGETHENVSEMKKRRGRNR